MTTSGLQTSKSAATFPRMLVAAPFGARPILLVALLLFAAPVWAEAPLRTIEVSMVFGRCHDALRTTYRNKGFIKPDWTLSDLGLKPGDLDGEVTDASNYGMYVDSISPPVVALVYRRHFEYQAHDEHRWVSADGEPVEDLNKPLPQGAGLSIWPNAKHDHVSKRLRREERIREEWLGLLDVWPWWLAALLIALFCWRTRVAHWDVVLGAFLISCAIVALMQYTGALSYPYGFASNALLYGMFGAVVIASVGAAIVNPHSSERFLLHVVGMAPAMMSASVTAGVIAQNAAVGIGIAVAMFGVLALLARWRTARRARQLSSGGLRVEVRL